MLSVNFLFLIFKQFQPIRQAFIELGQFLQIYCEKERKTKAPKPQSPTLCHRQLQANVCSNAFYLHLIFKKKTTFEKTFHPHIICTIKLREKKVQ